MADGLEYQCRECKAAGYLKRRQKRSAAGLCHCGRKPKDGYKTCEECQARVQQWMQEHPQEKKQAAQAWRDDLRKQIFDHYGRACRCPGCDVTEEAFLTIDHVNGGGTKHRREVGSGSAFFFWLVKNNFPPEFQTLCYNCNCAKGHAGICPHQQKKETHNEK